jgi:hypothetical protein
VTVLVMQTDATSWDSLVFDGINDLDVEAVTAAFGTIDVTARGRAAGAARPDCGRSSNRVHDSYQRRLKDTANFDTSPSLNFGRWGTSSPGSSTTRTTNSTAGPTEGDYGRASFELLRTRILTQP